MVKQTMRSLPQENFWATVKGQNKFENRIFKQGRI